MCCSKVESSDSSASWVPTCLASLCCYGHTSRIREALCFQLTESVGSLFRCARAPSISGMPPIAPWTARPLLFEVAQASKRVFTPRFGRQLRLEPLDTDTAGRVATQYHWSTHRGHRSLDLHFKIPRAVCVGTNAQGQPHMPGSAVLACFDHFSTYAISEVDESQRGNLRSLLRLTHRSSNCRRTGRIVRECLFP